MMRTFASIALAACALALSSGAAAQPRFDSLVIFGTSLSDPGNLFALGGGNNTPPSYLVDELLVPSVPYARGGHHFSDGATWVEQLARSLGMAASAKPALANESRKAANYAVGGARANNTNHPFDLGEQTAAFLGDRGGAPSSALYVVEMGGNDIRDAIAAFVDAGGDIAGQVAAQAVIGGALQSIGDNIFALWNAGARTFLVANAPNLGLTPAIRALDAANPGVAGLAAGLSQGFNGGLGGVLAKLSGLPGIELFHLDVHGKLKAIVEQPENFGLTNVTAACITPNVAPYHCKDFKDYLFWDGIHPTAAAHAIVAQEAALVLR
jgi:phospholipase/lecithinase/hemolysin